MSTTYTLTETFNVTHARKLAAKVVADMHQCNLLYKRGPVGSAITEYEQELVAMLAGGYIASYEFGFQDSTGKRVLSWKYTVGPSGDLEGGRSGGLYAQANLVGASLFNFMTTNTKWAGLPATEKSKVDSQHGTASHASRATRRAMAAATGRTPGRTPPAASPSAARSSARYEPGPLRQHHRLP